MARQDSAADGRPTMRSCDHVIIQLCSIMYYLLRLIWAGVRALLVFSNMRDKRTMCERTNFESNTTFLTHALNKLLIFIKFFSSCLSFP